MLRRFALITALVASVAFLSACGEEEEVTKGETEGVYVTADGVRYQVQISRVLNPADVEDREYLQGLDGIDAALKTDEDFFAVFLRAENESETKARAVATKFRIDDTTGAEFEPIEYPAGSNSHAYQPPARLAPETVYPAPNSTSGQSTTGGGLVLFKIPIKNFATRPLELLITAPNRDVATVDLDV